MPGKFGNVVLERDGEQLGRSCEKCRNTKCETRIVHKIKRWKVNWIGHILRSNCHKNTLLKERQTGVEDEE
jgi:hypothetical protein